MRYRERKSENRKRKLMADGLKERMKKLAIWYTRTFKPIINHDELEPIMATLGFVAVPLLPAPTSGGDSSTVWKEYFYSAAGCCQSATEPPPPRPRLPYPRIDGLHIYTYRAFWDAVNFYLGMNDDLSNLFHIRGMPLHGVNDLNRKWRRMEEHHHTVFLYTEGTLEQATHNFYNANKNDVNSSSINKECNSIFIRNPGNNIPAGCKIVPLKDIIVENLNCPKSKKCNKGTQAVKLDEL